MRHLWRWALRRAQDAGALLERAFPAGLLFPARCVGCKAYLDSKALACRRCEHAVFRVDGPICRVCGEPRRAVEAGFAGVDEVCPDCITRPPRFEQARSLWEYHGTIADAIQRAKYGQELWALRSLAERVGPWLDQQIAQLSLERPPLLTTVPMHVGSLRRRGFDQALMLLRLSTRRYALAPDLLEKTRPTPAQASLSRTDRLTNLRGAFSCREPARIQGRTVVLFDDVMTTGATANEVAKVLRSGGAYAVYVLTAARSLSA